MQVQVAVFTDTYLPTVNGVTYTINTWAETWNREYGRMDVVYPGSDEYHPASYEHPVPSLPFPFYEGFRMSAPWIPSAVRDADVVHVHSLAVLGVAGDLLGKTNSLPVVASYHTPLNEYSEYLVGETRLAAPARSLIRLQERIALGLVDHIVVPSDDTRAYLQEVIGTNTPISVISNGVDLSFFTRVPDPQFEWAAQERPVIGYTGRHGHEKRLELILRAAGRMESAPTVVLGGDGPARETLESLADRLDIEAEFIGFLPRERLPAFYSSLDVFAFPSPIETEGLVAMEAIACGTPVVGAEAGAIPETIRDGESGYLFPPSDIQAFADQLDRALANRGTLSAGALAMRDQLGLETTMAELESLYTGLVNGPS
ncbi:MAG: glycosyltransferase [Halolamina sp.]|uniref:glycosyltransferase n=1 Tax=Halolamina sp. TaxID=1940283 RepID=UPI002FC3B783